ncbi:pyridoxal phosphate-dependent aminotransferase [Solemya velum gill symbiont]|uniref:pyridoxal phosphate-dependent aminotransferase n=1 Tax=Solemya velum gill symbiont TaxID=2340 RepID=UPI000996AAB6|nr:pyridoxal phosphate-dependent aminotransferase [Solemya velum gill symbiont]OOY99634.1 aspartate aminotransferase [Solemya velum gill symbiont]OOZ01815.1 aspartate aminotransferase [Solemya velum gill symbiont]OOZ04155.1 aspartate aminotransferase [Solemya velum gill symbiont]OOZ06397.1 aspartate aminotransferase [Solemya velum gill symbiont]OOZ08599.1 aspartate aminotransferase [Solemya velum gill symbiont]
MSLKLSQRVQAVKPSPTLAITARAAELRAAGKDIIGLGAGEPDFDTPEHIQQAGIDAIKSGKTRYTAVDGTASLKQAIIDKFKRDNNFSFEADQILVSCGGKQSFYNLAQAILDPGDEVIIPAPYWVSYPDMAILAGGVPVYINADAEQNFKITPQQLETSITEATRLFVINSPSNPSGMAYSMEELEALGKVLESHPKIVIATDDMYEHILWEGTSFCNILNACPQLEDRIIVLNGVSKAYAMTGWRIGYAGGPVEIIKAMKKIQSQSTSNPTSISQYAAETALNGPKSCINDMMVQFKQRHDYVLDRFNRMPGIECLPSDGTFYLFPKATDLIESLEGISDDLQLADYLIQKAEVAVVPGSAFGLAGYFRVSIATSMEELETAMDRIEKAIS